MSELPQREIDEASRRLIGEGRETQTSSGLDQVVSIMREMIEQYPEFYGSDALIAQAYEGSAAAEGKPEGDRVMEGLWTAQDRVERSGVPAEVILFGGISSRAADRPEQNLRHEIVENLYAKLAETAGISELFSGGYDGLESMARALADGQQVELIHSNSRVYKREPLALIEANGREKGVQFGIGKDVVVEFSFPGVGRQHDGGGMSFVKAHVLPPTPQKA